MSAHYSDTPINYWGVRDSEVWKEIWPTLVSDVRVILEAADVDIGDRNGKPVPPLVDEQDGIRLNGIHQL